MNTGIYDIYRHRVQRQLVMEYSEGLITRIINKFKVETTDTEQIIRGHILRFDQLKAKLPADKRDIDKYTYADLLNVNAGNADLNIRKAEQDIDIKPIISEPGLKVYRVTTPNEAIAVRSYFETKYQSTQMKQHGLVEDGITWCVSRSYPSCLFYTYVDGPPSGGIPGRKATFYLIESDRQDKHFVSALQVQSDGDWKLTSSKNDGDITMTPNQVFQMYPQLRNHSGELTYQHLVLTPLQYDILRSGKYTITNFKDLPYDGKKLYISIGERIGASDFLMLPLDLKSLYIEIRSAPNTKYNVLTTVNTHGVVKYIEMGSLASTPTNVKDIYNFFINNLTGQLRDRFIFTILRNGTVNNYGGPPFNNYGGKHIFPLSKNGIIEWNPIVDGTVIMKDKLFVATAANSNGKDTLIANRRGEILTGDAITSNPAAAQLIKLYDKARELAFA